MRFKLLFTGSNLLIMALGFWIGRWTGCNHMQRTPIITPITNEFQPIDPDHGKHSSKTLDPKKAQDRTLFSSKVTVLSFCEENDSCEGLNRLLELYPGTKGIAACADKAKIADKSKFTNIGEFKNKGKALNALIGKVETEYFLHLDSHHHIGLPDSDQSVGWLLEALERVKSFDLIGGFMHVAHAHKGVYDTLEIPCYRLHHYNYTYSETYEYRESILDMMLCERTSSSFLANTSTFRSRGLSFDPHLKELLFEDFFLQAKTKHVAIATRMEVYFTVHEKDRHKRSAVQHVTTDFIPELIHFGLKHQVMTIVDVDQQVLQICERFSTRGTMFENKDLTTIDLFKDEQLLCDYDKARPYWKMKHWAYGGMFAPPTMMIALKRSMALAGDYFDAKGWSWVLVGGGALGIVKNGGFLPWEAGDIDVHMNISKKLCLDTLQREFVQRYPDYQIKDHNAIEIIIKPKRGFGGWVTIFFGKKYPPITKTVRMNFDGYWVQCSYYVFKDFRKWYSNYYLQHRMYNKKNLKCTEQSNSCLPDFHKLYNGRGGMWKEFFQGR